MYKSPTPIVAKPTKHTKDSLWFRQWLHGRPGGVEAVAALMGYNVQTIYRWANATTTPPSWKMIRLAVKGLSFSHGPCCDCQACYAKYFRLAEKAKAHAKSNT